MKILILLPFAGLLFGMVLWLRKNKSMTETESTLAFLIFAGIALTMFGFCMLMDKLNL